MKRIRFSKHALEQARERGISINEIKRTIQRGTKQIQGDKIISDLMYIRIVYRIIKGDYFIITAMIKVK